MLTILFLIGILWWMFRKDVYRKHLIKKTRVTRSNRQSVSDEECDNTEDELHDMEETL